MRIAVAGPYSAPSDEQRQRNLDALNRVAAELLRRGHVPVVGVNASLPIAQLLHEADRYEAIMRISLAVVLMCDAILVIGESPGACRERDAMIAQGKTVYVRLDDIPSAA